MRIIDEIKNKDLLFVEQEFDKYIFYEIYYLGTKLYQVKNKFDEAVTTWSNAVDKIAHSNR